MPNPQEARLAGTVSREGRPARVGWVSAWRLRTKTEWANVRMIRSCPVGADAYPLQRALVADDGTFALEGLKPGTYYVLLQEPGRAPTVTGPITLERGENRRLDVAAVEGGAIQGRVEGAPARWKGELWVVAFNESIHLAEARVASDGTFRLDGLPPGRYGLYVGHDAHEERFRDLKRVIDLESWAPADPWKHAVIAEAASGNVTEGVVIPHALAAQSVRGMK